MAQRKKQDLQDPDPEQVVDSDEDATEQGAGTLWQLRRARLQARIEELGVLLASCRSATQANEAWQCAKSSQATAAKACNKGKLQISWVALHQARRLYLAGLDSTELKNHRYALRREADEKLGNWRRLAVLDLLDAEIPDPADDKVVCSRILLAQRLLDEHFDNMYFKLQALGLRLQRLPWVLVAMILVILLLSWVWQTDKPGVLFFDFRHTVLVMVTGSLGALLSHTLSALHPGSRIPEFVADRTRWTVVPFVGALSAAGVILVIESGLLPVKIAPGTPLLGWALVGGFSDQLLKRALNKVEKGAEK